MLPSESDDFVALSGLQHLVFCERQAALIHVEQVWREDAATASGRILHERADLPGLRKRADVRELRAVPLRSDRLGIIGRADVVELHRDASAPTGWVPYPVEYKRGGGNSLPAARSQADQVQLCAQAMCLEEAYGVAVNVGALFYGELHRRVEVAVDEALRKRTTDAANRLRELVRTGHVPRVPRQPKCRGCSLEPQCLPQVTGLPGAASRYLQRLSAAGEK